MTERVIVRQGAYYDSVTLMLVSRAAGASVGMATPLNLELLARQGFTIAEAVTPNDLVIAIRDDDPETVLAAVDRELSAKAQVTATKERAAARSLTSAARRDPDLSLAFLSIPGDHVAHEAAAALAAGLHVFCFSDGVSLEAEARLKRTAKDRGLLFMGADCGTAIIDGVGLGFANAVRRGPVGIVGASGTGIQEVCCLLDAAGVGVSHAIGVGGRDLSAEVGGLMMRRGLELLAEDGDTTAIVAISKPPDPDVARAVEEAARATGKPVVLGFDLTLEEAARAAAEHAGGRLPEFDERLKGEPTPGEVRGLYSGGTLCGEAERIVGRGTFTDFGADEYTRGRAHPMIDPSLRLEQLAAAREPVLLLDVVLGYGAHPDPAAEHAGGRLPEFDERLKGEPTPGDVRGLYSGGTLCGEAERIVGRGTFTDFGADEYTQGRAHPMIDPSLRLEHLAAAREPVLLLDVVLGYGAHPDPAAELAPVIERLDRHVIVALCGAADDPQGLDAQRAALEAAGAVVTRSNAHAARLAKEASGG